MKTLLTKSTLVQGSGKFGSWSFWIRDNGSLSPIVETISK